MLLNNIASTKPLSYTRTLKLIKNDDEEYFDEALNDELTNLQREKSRGILKDQDDLDENPQLIQLTNYNRFWKQVIRLSSDPVYIEHLKNNYKLFQIACCGLTVIMILLSQVEYEIHYFPIFYEDSKGTYLGNYVRIAVSVLVLLLIVSKWVSYSIYYTIQIEEKKIINESFFNSYLFKQACIITIIDSIHPFPYVEYKFSTSYLGKETYYQIQTVLYSLMFLKLFHLLHLITVIYDFNRQLSSESKKAFIEETKVVFSMKVLLKEHPLIFLGISTTSIVVVVGIILRRFEMIDPEFRENYRFFGNGMWTVICSMLTGQINFISVGYGDFSPKSTMGKVISLIPILASLLILSFLIVSIRMTTVFQDDNENKAFTILKRIQIRTKLKSVCIEIIKIYLRLYAIKKKKRKAQVTKQHLIRNLKSLSKERTRLTKELQEEEIFSYDKFFVKMSARMKDEMQELRNEVVKLNEYKSALLSQLKTSKEQLQVLTVSHLVFKHKIKEKLSQLFKRQSSRSSVDSCYDIVNYKFIGKYASSLTLDEDSMNQILEVIIFKEDKQLPKDWKRRLNTTFQVRLEHNKYGLKNKFQSQAIRVLNTNRAFLLLEDPIHSSYLKKSRNLSLLLNQFKSKLLIPSENNENSAHDNVYADSVKESPKWKRESIKLSTNKINLIRKSTISVTEISEDEEAINSSRYLIPQRNIQNHKGYLHQESQIADEDKENN